MLFSVVIPTHDRLHLLRSAIETIRRQRNADWELVVFDNCSRDPVGEHVHSLNDPVFGMTGRTNSYPSLKAGIALLLWRKATTSFSWGTMTASFPIILSALNRSSTNFNNPISSTPIFISSGMPESLHGSHRRICLISGMDLFFVGHRQPFKLSAEDAARAVAGSLDFRINFSFNSQAFLYSRPFLEKLRSLGPIFRSPFPDYYIANVALVLSTSTIVVPDPLAVAGISKASYGYAMYNDQQAKGDALLNFKQTDDPLYVDMQKRLLPGPSYNTNFVLAMEHVVRSAGTRLHRGVNFRRYRQLQILAGAPWFRLGYCAAITVIIVARGAPPFERSGACLGTRLANASQRR